MKSFLVFLHRWLVRFLTQTGARLNLPFLTALGLTLTVRTLTRGGPLRVLCLARSIFLEDAEAVGRGSKRLTMLAMDKVFLGDVCRCFADTKELSAHIYYSEDNPQKDKLDDYYHFLKGVFAWLCSLLRLDCVLSGNFMYVEQQELARICLEAGFPFVILHKEGLTIPSMYKQYVERYYSGMIFRGTKLLVYNQRIQDAFIAKDIPGLSEDKICTVGIPRLDACFHAREKTAPVDKPCLAFFSFYSKDKFSALFRDDPERLEEILRRSWDFHKQVVLLAKENPDIRVIVKTKIAKHYMRYVKEIVREVCDEPPKNLEFYHEGDVISLIQQSNLVVGLNSTTLIQALILGKRIASPDFADLFTGEDWDYFRDYPELVHYLNDAQELAELLRIKQDLASSPLADRLHAFLCELVHTCDGKAGLRCEDEIVKLISASRNAENLDRETDSDSLTIESKL